MLELGWLVFNFHSQRREHVVRYFCAFDLLRLVIPVAAGFVSFIGVCALSSIFSRIFLGVVAGRAGSVASPRMDSEILSCVALGESARLIIYT